MNFLFVFRYARYQYDENGLYYLKSRMYNPVIARFMQEDTTRGQLNDPLSLNLYAYCNNNPLIYDDPDGQSLKSIVKKAKSTVSAAKKAVTKVVQKVKQSSPSKPTPRAVPKPAPKPAPKISNKVSSSNATKKTDNRNGTVTTKFYSRGEMHSITADKKVNPVAMGQGALRTLTDTARVAYASIQASEYAKQNAANSIGYSYCGTSTRPDSASKVGSNTTAIYANALANNDRYKDTLNYQGAAFLTYVAMMTGAAALDGVAARGASSTIKGAGNTLSNPFPTNGKFASVMPSKFAEQLVKGEAKLSGGSEAWITAADDLKGISTINGAANRLTLVDEAGNLRLQGNAVVEFELRDMSDIASPYNRLNPGFINGGRTGGGAREWVIPSDAQIANAKIRYLDK